MTLACEDATSKLVEIVPVADFDSEQLVDDSSVRIRKLKFGHKIEFCPDFEQEIWKFSR